MINTGYLQGYSNSIITIVNTILIPTLIAVSFAVFLWGVYKYFIQGANNETERGKGKTFALYGLIGFVVLFSVWGIVQIFMSTLGLSSSTIAPPPPTFNTGGGSNNSEYKGDGIWAL